MAWICKKDAYQRLEARFPDLYLNEKILNNWAKSGKEIAIIKNGNRIGFEDYDLENWECRIANCKVSLNYEDYLLCFKFAVEAYYGLMTRADFNRGKQRDVGEFITNQVQGKLGEIAVMKLLEGHGVKIKLDFDVTGQIPSQDISQISTRRGVWNNPSLKVSIKTTKLKNVLLAIPESEALIPDRRSDLYILSQVGLFPDHILRVIKAFRPEIILEHLDLIPDFGSIPVRVAGWTLYDTLVEHGPLSVLEINNRFGITMAGNNYIKVSGELSTDWAAMIELIV